MIEPLIVSLHFDRLGRVLSFISQSVSWPPRWTQPTPYLGRHAVPHISSTVPLLGLLLEMTRKKLGPVGSPYLSPATPSPGFWWDPSAPPPPESVPSRPCSSCWSCSCGCWSAETGDSSCLCCSSCPQAHWDPAGPALKRELPGAQEQVRPPICCFHLYLTFISGSEFRIEWLLNTSSSKELDDFCSHFFSDLLRIASQTFE